VEIDTVFGLPAHPLLVHGAVVLVPLAALGSIAVAFVPFLRRRLGWLVAAAAFGAMAMIPFVTGSGEAFEERVEETDLVERHTELGDGLLPWVIGLFVSILLVMVLDHLDTRGPGATGRGRLPARRPGCSRPPCSRPGSPPRPERAPLSRPSGSATAAPRPSGRGS